MLYTCSFCTIAVRDMHRYTIAFFTFSLLFLAALGAFTFYELHRHHGEIKEYYANGTLRSSVMFKNGKPDGVARTYYPNGNLRREAYFQNGVQHGLTRSYYENGQLKSEEYYEQSRLEGPAKFYEPDGRLQWEAVFHKGQIVDGTLKNYTRAHSSSAQP